MRAYHFTSNEHALDNLRNKRMKIATIGDMNDPFELLGMNLRDKEARKKFRSWRDDMASDYGFMCFSRNWHNPLLWSHYGDKHSGVCLGFDLSDEHLIDVIYTGSRIQLPNGVLNQAKGADQIMQRLLSAKYTDWAYEDEVRVFCDLADPDAKSGRYFSGFGDTIALKEVIAGPLCKTTAEQFRDVIEDQSVKLIKSRLAFKSYRIVKDKRGFKA